MADSAPVTPLTIAGALAREVLSEVEALPSPRHPDKRPSGPPSRLLGIDFEEIAQVSNKQLKDSLSEATGRLIEADLRTDHALRDFLYKLLQGSVEPRLTDVAFFTASIICSAAAQFLQSAGR